MMLRSTLRYWAEGSRVTAAWAAAYYRKKKDEHKNHETALRCLGQRWLKILWKMLKENKPYDEARHTRDQIRHGQWKLTLGADLVKPQSVQMQMEI